MIIYAQWEKHSEGIIVNFPSIANATVQYYTNVCGWQTVGVFAETCCFEIPEENKATWGFTTVQVLKDYTF
jgi:hypothetical protein